MPLTLGMLSLLASMAVEPAPLPPDSLRLLLNIPAFRLEVFQGSERIRSYRVSVGDTAHPTPVGSFLITSLEWDPWWVPPASDWAQHAVITPPGPANPMGRAKLFFRELYFIHGTPETWSLGRPASHGCIRLSNRDVVDLGRLIHQSASPALDGVALDSLTAAQDRSRAFQLERPVRIDIIYQVAVLEGERLMVYPDVYGMQDSTRVAPALAAVQAAGLREEAVKMDTLRRLLAANPRRQARIPLGEVVFQPDFTAAMPAR